MWLTDALNSHTQIICFGSVFEAGADFVSFDVAGHYNFSPQDRVLRDRDFAEFLRTRIFGEHSGGVGTVGFKLQYKNVFGFPGLLKHLIADQDLKVVHLRRHNLLRSLISLRLAQTTGYYHRKPLRLGWRRLATAARHPARAIERLRVHFAQRDYRPSGLTLTKEECELYFREIRWSEAHYRDLFSEHEWIDVLYEAMVADLQEVLGSVQEFLGVRRQPLTYTQLPLNTAPMREILDNYDELRMAFQGLSNEEFFADG